MILAVGLVLLAAIVGGFRWLDRRAEKRRLDENHHIATRGDLVERMVDIGFAELHEAIRPLQQDAREQKELLASIDRRIAANEKAVTLLPAAIEGFRTRLDRVFEELQEAALPPESKAIGESAMTRVQSIRDRMRAEEEKSLRQFTEAAEQGARPVPIRVRPGD